MILVCLQRLTGSVKTPIRMVESEQFMRKAAKTYLQEICQGNRVGLPHYEVSDGRNARMVCPYPMCGIVGVVLSDLIYGSPFVPDVEW